MDHKTVALDMDSTLAASSTIAADFAVEDEYPSFAQAQSLGEDVLYADVDSRGWGRILGSEGFPADFQVVLDGFRKAWLERSDDIEPMEPYLDRSLQRLSDHGYKIQVLTAQPQDRDITTMKRKWLKSRNIPFDAVVPVPYGTSKTEYPYWTLVDDKPSLAAELMDMEKEGEMRADLFLRDQPYNRGIDVEESDCVHRVHSVGEAVNGILGGSPWDDR